MTEPQPQVPNPRQSDEPREGASQEQDPTSAPGTRTTAQTPGNEPAGPTNEPTPT